MAIDFVSYDVFSLDMVLQVQMGMGRRIRKQVVALENQSCRGIFHMVLLAYLDMVDRKILFHGMVLFCGMVHMVLLYGMVRMVAPNVLCVFFDGSIDLRCHLRDRIRTLLLLQQLIVAVALLVVCFPSEK